jgi:hypothetical protein
MAYIPRLLSTTPKIGHLRSSLAHLARYNPHFPVRVVLMQHILQWEVDPLQFIIQELGQCGAKSNEMCPFMSDLHYRRSGRRVSVWILERRIIATDCAQLNWDSGRQNGSVILRYSTGPSIWFIPPNITSIGPSPLKHGSIFCQKALYRRVPYLYLIIQPR